MSGGLVALGVVAAIAVWIRERRAEVGEDKPQTRNLEKRKHARLPR